jgi:hypothetical protein
MPASEHRPSPSQSRKPGREPSPVQISSVAAEILAKAKSSGLLDDKSSRISGRVSSALVEQAKRRTGIAEDTQLIEFALASLALEDNFPAAFKAVKGTVDPDIKLGF